MAVDSGEGGRVGSGDDAVLGRIVQRMKSDRPRLFENVEEAQVLPLLRAALETVRREIEATGRGTVSFRGFGMFRVWETAEGERSILFRPRGGESATRGHSPSILTAKALSGFARAADMEALLAHPGDALLVVGPSGAEAPQGHYLQDAVANDQPYLLQLRHAKLIPANHVGRCGDGDSEPLPSGVRHHPAANLLLSERDEIFADSTFRYGFVPEALAYQGDGRWRATLPEKFLEVEGLCIYADLICGHFGHALVETPARLWPLLDLLDRGRHDLRFVGFGSHGVQRHHSSWPGWLKELLVAYGIDPLERLLIANRPVRCERLIVPRRFSPNRGRGGVLFDRTLQRAGKRLAGEEPAGEFGGKIYLSRSRLEANKRPLERGQEAWLEGLFRDRGFAVLHPQEMTLRQQVAAVRGATHIAGCIGSQLHLLAFCPSPPPKVLRIAPSSFDQRIDRRILKAKGGTVTELLVESERLPGRRRGTTGWAMTDSDRQRLEQLVGEWDR